MVKSITTAFIFGVIAAGVLLQLTIGEFPLQLLSGPLSTILIISFPLISIIISFFRKSLFYKWFTGTSLTIGLLTSLLLLSILMGLGWWSITRSWPFVLIYTILLLTLGCIISNKIICLRDTKNLPFIFNHLGIYIVLLFGGVGYADIKKYTMEVSEGTVEWRAYNEDGVLEELPLAIQLNKFEMSFHQGSTEPRSFISDIELYSIDNHKIKGQISVNNPLKYSQWRIYQYGYNSTGIHKISSTFLLVYDPWLGFVYSGFIIMAIGATLLIIGKYGKHDME